MLPYEIIAHICVEILAHICVLKELQLHNFIKLFAFVNEILTGMGRNSATPGIGSDRSPAVVL